MPNNLSNNNNNNNDLDNNNFTTSTNSIFEQQSSSSLCIQYPFSSSPPLINSNSNNSLQHLPILKGYLLKHTSLSYSSTGSGTGHGNGLVLASTVGAGFRKKRWFVFSAVTGKLYYFRNHEDLFPIGEIDIRSASFVIKTSKNHPSSGSSGSGFGSVATNSHLFASSFVFEIVTKTKTITLEASSSTEGFRWVKNLQIFRQHLCNQCKYSKNYTQILQSLI